MRIFGHEQTWHQAVVNFLVALLLATMLWTWAQFEQDPNERRVYHLSLDVRNLPTDMLLLNPDVLEKGVMVTILAPQSVLRTRLPEDALQAWIDLADLPPGQHTVPVHVISTHTLVRVLHYTPQTVTVDLDQYQVRDVPVRLRIESAPTDALRNYEIRITPQQARVSGPARAVRRVVAAQASVQLADGQTVPSRAKLLPVDTQGNPVPQVDLTPSYAQLSMEATPGRYREVPIRVVLKGQPARGYHIAQVMVKPPLVTLYDPTGQHIEDIMFVETEPINIDGASGPVTNKVALQIPEGLQAVDITEALVEVAIEPLVSTLKLDGIPVHVKGLAQGLTATVQPQTIALLISGPAPVLSGLDPQADIQVVVDVTNLSVGTYTLEPQIQLPEELTVVQIIPPTIQVALQLDVTPTPTATAAP